VAFDVAARVGLRVACGLSGCEHFVVAPTLVGHRGEDVVRRAVDDPPHRRDPVRREVRSERAEDRNAAADGSLEAKRRPAPSGESLQLWTVMCEHVLVRGDDRLAGAERRRDQRPCRLVTADQFHDDVGVRGGHEVSRRIGEQLGRQAGRTRPIDVPHGDPGEGEFSAVGRHQLRSTLQECPRDLPTHRSCAEQRDPERSGAHPHLRRWTRDGRVIGPNGKPPASQPMRRARARRIERGAAKATYVAGD
jgi:hypothetical protein